MAQIIKNILGEIPSQLPHELFNTLLENQYIKLERIVSNGHITPKDKWYTQVQDEWVILLKGHARISFKQGEEVTLKEGDYLLIPAQTCHRVSWIDPNDRCIWLALHCFRAMD